ncbi:hypothetical protein [Thalassobacillus sp. CUG 92003]|uniref:hypothetical protein n=1 Tax=Thalassobacillus sp. CUG 92003 TaxID=2736641 RepID=UPI0015E7105A|nr:hypothetical protein [Thalassobacillus sp. CUG 92003]
MYSIEIEVGNVRKTVYETNDIGKVRELSPTDYGVSCLFVKEWKNGEIVHSYKKEISKLF